MPFKSEKQRRYLWAKHPEVAQEWSDKYGSTPESRKKAAENEVKRHKKRHKKHDEKHEENEK